MARASRSEDDPRTGYGLARLVDEQAVPTFRSAALLRISSLQGVFQRHLRPVDEPWHRSLPLLHGRELSGVGRGEWRHFCLARRPGESRHLPGTIHLSEGFPGELRDELWQ